MGQALEKRASGRLRSLLAKMTGTKMAGFLTGLGVTAIIQSSSATTVMVVGFVNSGLMTLMQAINVIMGANVGTTVTAWILSLSGISSDAVWVRLLKPSSFTPVLALTGIVLYLAWNLSKRIVKPLNEMNLDQPDEKLVYEELASLVKRLNAQQREIAAQRAILQRRRDEFEAATRHMREGIILLDEKGCILSINDSARAGC